MILKKSMIPPPKPSLYRTTNNTFVPSVNSKWISENDTTIQVTKVYPKKTPIIICYKTEDKCHYGAPELSLSLQRFYSLFSSFD